MTSIPTSTYRLQVRDSFTLDDAARVCDYLADLGIGAVYLSPVLASVEGSAHGYDVSDPTAIDTARGGEAGWRHLVEAAERAGLGVVVDIVPNHLGIDAPAQNPSWWDVLTHGPDSAFASWYDVEWANLPITIPILGGPDDVDRLTLDRSRANPELRYYGHRFPVAPGTADDDADDAVLVHERQHYRLMDWRRGDSELNYRRFFAVTTLAGVRVEDPAVFAATHARTREMVRAGQVVGLRVDHPDGLVDPGEYFERLREMAPGQWLIGEKILEPGEELPDWPIEGTSGYDAMTEVNNLFVDAGAEAAMTALYVERTGDERDAHEHVRIGKALCVDTLFRAERARMARLTPELDAAAVVEALGVLATRFEVYRSYLPDGVELLDEALAKARAARPDLAETLDALAPRLHDAGDEVAQRLQQLTGAVMAKGVEDTAFYRYARLIGLNEVGGNLAAFGSGLAGFHDLQRRRQDRLPQSMTALSTHDTKRSEDVRARLAVLPEIPGRWAVFAAAFASHTAIPNPQFGYFLAQTLLGVGPVERERLHDYAEKAMREAAVDTTWTEQNEAFEASVHAAVDAAYDDPGLNADWRRLDAALREPTWSNALSAKLVQLTMPGIPDVYQGTELFDYSLVDPDNRRPVDFELRRSLLNEQSPALDETGVAKLWVTRQALRLRNFLPFDRYAEVPVIGAAAEHLIAFDRGGAITLATRLPVGLADRGGWGETRIELDGSWHDQLTGREVTDVSVAGILDRYPVALLTPLDNAVWATRRRRDG